MNCLPPNIAPPIDPIALEGLRSHCRVSVVLTTIDISPTNYNHSWEDARRYTGNETTAPMLSGSLYSDTIMNDIPSPRSRLFTDASLECHS